MSNDPVPTFGHLMCLLAERSVDAWRDERGVMRTKLTEAERSVQCSLWAQEYPGMALDLEAIARQYARRPPMDAIRGQNWPGMRQPGDERLEDI